MTKRGKHKGHKRHKLRAEIFIFALLLITAILTIRAYMLYKHPKGYSEYVEKYSAMFGVDELIIYSIIKTESGYDPNAVSEDGARGLMQIMSETFDWIKFRLNDNEGVTYGDMFDPETNIKYGSYLFSILYDEFKDIDTAMAAYHAGRGQVNRWLETDDYSDEDGKLDNIPSKVTGHYVDKIRKAMDMYALLY